MAAFYFLTLFFLLGEYNMAFKTLPLFAVSAILLSGCTSTCGSKAETPAADAAAPAAPAADAAAPTAAPADAAAPTAAPADAAAPTAAPADATAQAPAAPADAAAQAPAAPEAPAAK